MDQEMLSIQEMLSFREANPQIRPICGEMYIFTATITYLRPGKKDIVEITKVQSYSSGAEPWVINIEETGEINSKEVYTHFNSKFDKYIYDAKNNALTVTARTSPKGSYKMIMEAN